MRNHKRINGVFKFQTDNDALVKPKAHRAIEPNYLQEPARRE